MPAVPALVKALGDPDSGVRAAAALALWKIQKHPNALPALIELLRDGQDAAPYQAAVALGQLGAEAEAMAALTAALDHGDADVRRAAARSLGQAARRPCRFWKRPWPTATPRPAAARSRRWTWIGPPAAGQLIAALGDGSPAVRRAAARRWAGWDSSAKAAEPR